MSQRENDLPAGNQTENPEDLDLDLDDALPDIDPNGQENRDRSEVEDAQALGSGLARELRYERDAEEKRTMDVLETMRNLEHADEIEWRISRTGADDPALNGYLETWASSLMTLDRLRDRFGGGKYYLHGTRRGRYFQHKTITIAGDAIRKGQKVDSNAGQGPAFDYQAFIAQQDARDERRRREEDERRERSRQERKELLTIFAPVIAAVLPAILGKKDDTAALIAALKPKETSPLELIQLMKEMRNLDEKPNQPNALDSAMALLDRFKEMGMFESKGGSETSWFDIAKEGIRSLGPSVGQGIQTLMEQAAMAKAMEARAQGGNGNPRLPAPSPAAPGSRPGPVPPLAPGHTAIAGSPAGSRAPMVPVPAGTADDPSMSAPTPISEDDAMLKLLGLLPWLKSETERLLVAAARDSDPELRAAAMYDDLPDDADIESVGTVLSRSDWFQLFQQLDSRVTQYAAFFAAVRSSLLQLIAEDTGVAFPAKEAAGIDPASGREKVSVVGPRRRIPDGPIERPGAPPPLTGTVETREEIEGGEE